MTTTIITTCKGRLTELTESVASWLALPCPILIVSDGCPELERAPLPDALRHPRITIRMTGAAESDHFSKPRALNFGARAADTEQLLFLDSDTLVRPEFWAWYAPRAAPDAQLSVPMGPDCRDLTGVLGVARDEYLAVGGADEAMLGWGSEDIDVRLRLYLERGLRIIDIPPRFLTAIPHNDARRTEHYAEQDKMASHRQNLQRLVTNAERITQRSIWSLIGDANVRRMLGAELGLENDGQAHPR